jgi:outer membrane biosynthesis protein TonB
MITDSKSTGLQAYEVYIPTSATLVERLFAIIFSLTLVLFIGLGLYFTTVEPFQPKISENIERIKTQFLIQEKKVAEEKPKPKVSKKKEEKPVDLTKKPELKQKEDDDKPVPKQEQPIVKRVYGLKKVYSKGLGSGGSLSDAVIGKLGNTLNKEVDTITASQADLKGEVVSTTTVTSAPRFKKRVKPEYSPEMLENRIEGVVKVKVLVDIDGKVKKAIALNDLGFGSKERAVNACFAMEFESAMRGSEAVAVWIIIPIRFVLLG